jgi:hypothetical protein
MTTPNEDGTYTIIVNALLSRRAAVQAVVHELQHIDGADFSSETQATLLEKMVSQKCRHGQRGHQVKETFNFFCNYL